MITKRNTPQKGVILDTLRRMGTHPTAGEVYAAVHRRSPTISRSTVYRVLGQLAEDGTILRVCLAGSDDRFDGSTHPHNHIRCQCCGAVADIPWVEVGMPADTSGYVLTSYTVEYEGVCPRCQKASRTG